MRVILNDDTKTVHKAADGDSYQSTDCGALRHVPDDRMSETSQEKLASGEDMKRCGRCFENAGGY